MEDISEEGRPGIRWDTFPEQCIAQCGQAMGRHAKEELHLTQERVGSQ